MRVDYNKWLIYIGVGLIFVAIYHSTLICQLINGSSLGVMLLSVLGGGIPAVIWQQNKSLGIWRYTLMSIAFALFWQFLFGRFNLTYKLMCLYNPLFVDMGHLSINEYLSVGLATVIYLGLSLSTYVVLLVSFKIIDQE